MVKLLIALALALVAPRSAPAELSGDVQRFPAAVVVAETMAEYNRMNEPSAAQIWSAGAPASQWTWATQPDGSSHIAWGDPAAWPPASAEVFSHAGDWLMLDGWHDNGTYYAIATSAEYVETGGVRVELAAGGAQHYAKWTVPAVGESYSVFTAGTITEQSTGNLVRFVHAQLWRNIGDCANAYHAARPCVEQTEQWWDDNGSPFALRLDRTTTFAKGVGAGWKIAQTVPAAWTADLRYWWDWA